MEGHHVGEGVQYWGDLPLGSTSLKQKQTFCWHISQVEEQISYSASELKGEAVPRKPQTSSTLLDNEYSDSIFLISYFPVDVLLDI